MNFLPLFLAPAKPEKPTVDRIAVDKAKVTYNFGLGGGYTYGFLVMYRKKGKYSYSNVHVFPVNEFFFSSTLLFYEIVWKRKVSHNVFLSILGTNIISRLI